MSHTHLSPHPEERYAKAIVIVELSWRVSKDEAQASRARAVATWFETRCCATLLTMRVWL
jgi:hypothetical protein